MYRFIPGIAFTSLILSCNTYKVRLNTFTNERFAYLHSHLIKPNEEDVLFAKFLNVDSFVILERLHNPRQYYYDQFVQGSIDSLTLETKKAMWKYNFTPCPNQDLDAESRFFLGKKMNGDLIIIADEDNDNSFQNDRIHLWNKEDIDNNEKKLNAFPKVKLSNLEICQNGIVKKHSLKALLKPSIVSQFSVSGLAILTGKAVKGKLKKAGKVYEVEAYNYETSFFGARDINLFFKKMSNDPYQNKKFDYVKSYREGDTILLGGQPILIGPISKNLKKLKLFKSYSKTVFPVRMSQKNVDSAMLGRTFPTLSDDLVGLTDKDLNGKIVFINFWFFNCVPCLNEMPALNEMYEELKDNPDFKFVSFTFEPEERIEAVKKKFNLQFDIYSIPQSECERLSRSVFYPVNIILDRERKIKYYATGGPDNEAEGFEHVSNRITPIILDLLQ